MQNLCFMFLLWVDVWSRISSYICKICCLHIYAMLGIKPGGIMALLPSKRMVDLLILLLIYAALFILLHCFRVLTFVLFIIWVISITSFSSIKVIISGFWEVDHTILSNKKFKQTNYSTLLLHISAFPIHRWLRLKFICEKSKCALIFM